MAIYFSESVNPWHNLALEALLLERCTEPSLYLWQNQRTVVIGRHQNPWVECDLKALEAFGGRLARRLSGGGAVYHDLGNLNFTFLMPRAVYDVPRQCGVLCRAVRRFGIDASVSGRNDLCVGERKFSGNAFCVRENAAYHHGTLLVDVDIARMTGLLTVDPGKLQSKAIASVRSRVVNLIELAPTLEIPQLQNALCDAFRVEYDPNAAVADPEELDPERIRGLEQLYGSWDWLYGNSPRFDWEGKQRFVWGGVQLALHLQDGKIADCRVFSDALDTELPDVVRRRLIGCPFDGAAMANALLSACTEHIEHASALADLAVWCRGAADLPVQVYAPVKKN